MTRELTLIERSFEFSSNFGNYYFKDTKGNCYCWRTLNDKAYEEMLENATYLCTFKITNRKFNHDKFGEVEMIKYVRF